MRGQGRIGQPLAALRASLPDCHDPTFRVYSPNGLGKIGTFGLFTSRAIPPTIVGDRDSPDPSNEDKMDIQDIERLARDEMDKHGLIDAGWTFRWNGRIRAAGLCNYTYRTIELSRVLSPKRANADILDTIRHEIAHALAPRGAHHGREWREIARSLGARPETCISDTAACAVPPKYQAVCPNHGILPDGRHRMPKTNRTYYHKKCGAVIGWRLGPRSY